MIPPRRPETGPHSEADFERLLGESLRRDALSPSVLNRVRAAVEEEWRGATAKQARRGHAWRLGVWTAAAAAACIIAVGLIWWVPAAGQVIVGAVARSDSGGVERRLSMFRHAVLRKGDAIRVGDTLEMRGATLLSWGHAGTLRVAGGSVIEVSGDREVNLERGLIYVDLPPGASVQEGFRLQTRVGPIEHLGTAFEVLSDARTVRVRVREGAVRWLAPAGALVASVGMQISINSSGELARGDVPTYGRDWMWVEALAPDFDIEGRSLADFLRDISRELGRRVEFVDEHAREVAARTILHGSVRGREPIEALDSVLATTTLTYELSGEAIRVHSGP